MISARRVQSEENRKSIFCRTFNYERAERSHRQKEDLLSKKHERYEQMREDRLQNARKILRNREKIVK